jgi:hypothetical protein
MNTMKMLGAAAQVGISQMGTPFLAKKNKMIESEMKNL